MLTRFNNLSIGAKLYGLASLLLALMLIIGVLGIKNLVNVSDQANRSYANATKRPCNEVDQNLFHVDLPDFSECPKFIPQ